MSDFTVQAGEFSGPIDLLLSLIEKRKMHISDVSLAAVADGFIEFCNKEEGIEIARTSHFIYVASTLLLIKSKALLPGLELTNDEEADIFALKKRLKLLQLVRKYVPFIDQAYMTRRIFIREPDKHTESIIFSPPVSLTTKLVGEMIAPLLKSVPKKEKIEETSVRKIISLDVMIDSLKERVERGLKMSFKEFSSAHKAERVNVVVSFLAMLELVKQGAIAVSQNNHFEDIEMQSQKTGVPQYN